MTSSARTLLVLVAIVAGASLAGCTDASLTPKPSPAQDVKASGGLDRAVLDAMNTPPCTDFRRAMKSFALEVSNASSRDGWNEAAAQLSFRISDAATKADAGSALRTTLMETANTVAEIADVRVNLSTKQELAWRTAISTSGKACGEVYNFD